MSSPVLVRPSGDGGAPVIAVLPGAHVLRDVSAGASLAAHRRSTPPPPSLSVADLLARVRAADVRGRGGAGFPFATKLEAVAAAGRHREVVVNLSEGEPVSFKDAALGLTRPHLVLDGAVLVARALGSRVVHVVLPGERAGVAAAVRRAVAERGREDTRTRWRLHRAEARFVAGQARAVVELMSGRPNLPVTSWQPAALHGYRGRPTLLSNAETFAHVAVLAGEHGTSYAATGTAEEPGTRLLTLGGHGERPTVTEVAHGTPWEELLSDEALDSPSWSAATTAPGPPPAPCAVSPCPGPGWRRPGSRSAPGWCSRCPPATAPCTGPPRSWPTSPASPRGAAGPVATGCPRSPTRCSPSTAASTGPPAPETSPAWSPAAEPARTRTVRRAR